VENHTAAAMISSSHIAVRKVIDLGCINTHSREHWADSKANTPNDSSTASETRIKCEQFLTLARMSPALALTLKQ